jgi:hypothetical protein
MSKNEEILLKEFENWMGPKERIAHTLALKMLGSSYDPVKTHLFKKFMETKTVITSRKS